jgi:two-component system, NarL family, sensor histidine kinase FusK
MFVKREPASQVSSHQHLPKLFRPWPLRPLQSAVFAALALVLVSLAVLSAANPEWQPRYVVLEFFSNPFPYLVFLSQWGLLELLRSLGKKRPDWSGRLYLLGALGTSAIAISMRATFLNENSPEYWREPSGLIGIGVGSLLLFLLLHVTMGSNEERLREEIERVNQANKVLEIQRQRLVESDERVRKEMADYLHDNLQADLLVLGMQIKNAIEPLDESSKKIAMSFLEEIERIRQVDVRDAARQLVPDLQSYSLLPVLRQLINRYERSMEVDLVVEELGEELSYERRLSCYRIVEQALLNAASHGKATKASVSIKAQDQSVEILVRNNGAAPGGEYVPGVGLAVIESRTKLFDGSWSLGIVAGETEFRATLN